MEPVGNPNDPEVSLGSFRPTTRLIIASGGLLELFLGCFTSLTHSANLFLVELRGENFTEHQLCFEHITLFDVCVLALADFTRSQREHRLRNRVNQELKYTSAISIGFWSHSDSVTH